MELASYFDKVPRLRVHDPLARVLGCAKGGVLEDTRAAVDVSVDLALVPFSPAIEGLMSKLTACKATADEEAQLGKLWQERVRHLLLEFARDPAVFVVRPVERRAAPSVPLAAT